MGDIKFLTTKQAAAYLSLSPHTLNKWRLAEGMGPRVTRFGRLVKYRSTDLEDFALTGRGKVVKW